MRSISILRTRAIPTDADRELAGAKRSDPMQSGYAVQRGTVRFLGPFLEHRLADALSRLFCGPGELTCSIIGMSLAVAHRDT